MSFFVDGGRRILDTETRKARKVRATLVNFARYFRRYWPGLLISCLLILTAAWATVNVPEVVSQAVDCYIVPQATRLDACWYTEIQPEWLNNSGGQEAINARLSGVAGLVGIMLGLLLLNAASTGLGFHAMRWSAQNVIRQLQRDLFTHIQRLPLGYYSQHEGGDVMSRVTNDMDTIQQTFSFALLQVLLSVVIVVWIVVRMLQTNLIYALVSLAVVPVMLWTSGYFSQQARRAFREARKSIGSVNADLQESIAGAREVQAFSREEESIAQFEASNDANRRANVKAALFTSALNPVLEALGYVSLGTVVVFGGLAILGQISFLSANAVSIGMVFAFIAYTQRANQPIQQIALLWTNVQSGIAGGERIFDLLATPVEDEVDSSAAPMPPIRGRVVFEDVEAQYKEGEKVLKGISFAAEMGQTVAIVGPTGAGKTTIINLLPRFYDPSAGRVLIDGIDIRTVDRHSLRRQIGIVLQDTYLFSTSVMENIRYGKLNATDEEVIAAAKMVAAHDFIERLPQGYQTVLGERGSGLSQGQRQLIAIARVALMNPRILILDEATSSVDTRTERVIQAAFEKLLKGRTSFVIAHRLSTIRSADQVLLLRDGQIVERGTHQSLLAQRGAYYDLYMSQFRQQEEAEAVLALGNQPEAAHPLA
ncbi:MAG: ABC transporter ATP-binding protein/permease [Anaerolineae bacterium]|nr:ABC transporter ATP-binding protein/permease [Anaerolineae bacterium]MDW8170863.1 ABC transporter ATP-binding protein [Anaerolineae bacterium]